MSKITKDEFKNAVIAAFEERGYSKIKISMSFFGMQCDISYHQDGVFGKQEAHACLKESGGKQLIAIEQKNGIDWSQELPE